MALPVRRCVLCGAAEIGVSEDGRVVTVTCLACDAVFEIEYDPPDQPDLRGRIEILQRGRGAIRAD